MSGEVRFTHESGHRVPHDPLLGLDRSIDMLEQVIDSALPYSNEESAALFLMANTMSRRGDFPEAVSYYKQALLRNLTVEQRGPDPARTRSQLLPPRQFLRRRPKLL